MNCGILLSLADPKYFSNLVKFSFNNLNCDVRSRRICFSNILPFYMLGSTNCCRRLIILIEIFLFRMSVHSCKIFSIGLENICCIMHAYTSRTDIMIHLLALAEGSKFFPID